MRHSSTGTRCAPPPIKLTKKFIFPLDESVARPYSKNMTLAAIIDVILHTPDLSGKRIYLAALVARDGHAEARAEVVAFWREQGGRVIES